MDRQLSAAPVRAPADRAAPWQAEWAALLCVGPPRAPDAGLAERLRAGVRAGDTVAPLGPGLLGVVLRGAGPAAARAVAARLAARLGVPVTILEVARPGARPEALLARAAASEAAD